MDYFTSNKNIGILYHTNTPKQVIIVFFIDIMYGQQKAAHITFRIP